MAEWRNTEKRLGFGLMRLPRKDNSIDIDSFKALADRYIEAGFTYFDTAYVYDGSEVAFREAVAKRYPRSAYTIADKMAAFKMNDHLKAEDMFKASLERCGVDYFDYYLLHSLQPSRINYYDTYDCWEFCSNLKKQGFIKNLGFSFHGGPELLEEILTKHPEVDFVQLQLNYADWYSDAIFSKANYDIVVAHGKDLTVMEPVKGGILANLKPEASAEFAKLDPSASAASYALRFVASLPNVKMVLSGMNAMDQLEDNIKTFNAFKPLTEDEKKSIEKVREILLDVPVISCTACRYCCEGCPAGINIPEVFRAYNMYLTFGDHNRPGFYYDGIVATGSAKANECIACGQCEAACPQHIKIINEMKHASEYLDKR